VCQGGNGIRGIKHVVSGVKELVELNKCRGNVGWVHNEAIGKSKSFDTEELSEPKEVRVGPNDVAWVH
jgi:hypothetical protein